MVYHGLSWFIMVYHGLSWFSLLKYSIHLGLSTTGAYVPGIIARFLTNSSVDVWLAARDEQKTFDSQRGPGLLRRLGTPMVAMRIRRSSGIRKFGCFQIVFETRSFEAVSDGPKWLSSQHRSQAASRIHCVFGSLSFVHPHCLSYPLFIGVPQWANGIYLPHWPGGI